MVMYFRLGTLDLFAEKGNLRGRGLIYSAVFPAENEVDLARFSISQSSFIFRPLIDSSVSDNDILEDLKEFAAELAVAMSGGPRFVVFRPLSTKFADCSRLAFESQPPYRLSTVGSIDARTEVNLRHIFKFRADTAINKRVRLSLDAGNNRILIGKPPSGVLKDVSFELISGLAGVPIVDDIAIDLGGDPAGIVRCKGSNPPTVTAAENLAKLRAGLFVGAQKTLNGSTTLEIFGVLGSHGGPLEFGFHVDPFEQLDRTRSWIDLSVTGSAVIETTLRTTHGAPLRLATQEGSGGLKPSRLVFAEQKLSDATNQSDRPQCLLIDGDFPVVLTASQQLPSLGLACGLSEREYIPLEPDSVLSFRPDRRAHYGTYADAALFKDGAYAPAKIRSAVAHAVTLAAAGPTDHVVSSWIGVRSGASRQFAPDTRVVSESGDFSLFKDSAASLALRAAGNGSLLDHAPLSLRPKAAGSSVSAGPDRASAGATEVMENEVIPVHPWVGLVTQGTPETYRTLELLRLQAHRRSMLEPVTQNMIADRALSQRVASAQKRYTPMGLEIRELDGERIKAVLLARSNDEKGDPQGEMLLGDIPPTMSDALMRSDLFILCDQYPENEPNVSVVVRGWTFKLDLPKGAPKDPKQSPILIIKGVKGQSIEQLLDKPASWALRDELCSKPPAEMKALAIAAGPKANDPEKLYQKLKDVWTSPNWTGVLVLNLRLDPGGLPDQITGLLAGAKDQIEKLRGHHLGIDVNRIDLSNSSPPTMQASPIFGLIDFDNQTTDPKIPQDESYYVHLLKLVTQFENGEVRDFRATVMFGVRDLFEGTVCGKLANKPLQQDVFITIKGSYEKRHDGDNTIDVYSFGSEDHWEFDFNTEPKEQCKPSGEPKGLIAKLRVDRLTFGTKRVVTTPSGKHVEALFAIDGSIDLNAWPKMLPLFERGDKISFHSLGIDLNFDLIGASIETLNLDFAPRGFDLDLRKLKDFGGIFRNLPLKFDKFHWWPGGIDLPQLGFFRLGGGRTSSDVDSKVPFGLSFDLDLGSLGNLSSFLAKLKIKILAGFGYEKDRTTPKFLLGFKFENNGGGPLDISLGPVLSIRAKAYDFGKSDSTGDYFFYALDAKLIIGGYDLPEKGKFNVFFFVGQKKQQSALLVPTDADALETGARLQSHLSTHRADAVVGQGSRELVSAQGSDDKSMDLATRGVLDDLTIGWFAVMTGDKGSDASFKLGVLALGQKVDPLNESFGSTSTIKSVKQLVDYVERDLGNLDESIERKLEAHDYDAVTDFFDKRIRLSPEHAWTGALRVTIADIVALDLLVRDPDLYGARLAVGDLDDPWFAIDIIYRKLSDDLGVYSVEIVPPPAIRQIQCGAASITIPCIRIDIYTDGGFNVDVGFPANRDFSRSCRVEIGVFTGGGGFYFGRLSGLGARLIPNCIMDKVYRYDPVMQLGFGARVGIGRSFGNSVFYGTISLTVYSYLEGAQGRLRILDESAHQQVPANLRPADTFMVVSGSYGILGEIIAKVDFKIIKADIWIVAYAEVGVVLRTEDAIRLYFEVGVSVSVTVEIARFRIFGKTIVISISLSFQTTFHWETTAGSRDPHFNDKYVDKSSRFFLSFLAQGLRLTEDKITSGIDWTYIPAPTDIGWKNRVSLKPWFLPDVTAAPEFTDQQKVETVPHLVFTLYLADDDGAKPADPTSVEYLVSAIAYWLLWAALDRPTNFLDRPIDRDSMHQICRRLAKLAAEEDPRPSDALPQMSAIQSFVTSLFDVDLTKAPAPGSDAEKPRVAGVFPLPTAVKLKRDFANGVSDTIDLAAQNFLTADIEARLEEAFDHLDTDWRDSTRFRIRRKRASGKTMAEEVFEEYVGHIMRSIADELFDVTTRFEQERRDTGAPPKKVSELIEALLYRATDARSRAQNIGASASRFFQHGLAFKTDPEWATIKSKVPAGLAALVDGGKLRGLPLYRYASVQLPLVRWHAGKWQSATEVTLEGTGAAWFKIAGMSNGTIAHQVDPTSPDKLLTAAADLEAYGASVDFTSQILDRADGALSRGDGASYVRRLTRKTNAGIDNVGWVFGLPDPIVNSAEIPGVQVKIREVGTTARLAPAVILDPAVVTPSVAVELRVKQVMRPLQGSPTGDPPPVAEVLDGIYEIAGMRESDRRLLDALLDPPDSGAFFATAESALSVLPSIKSTSLHIRQIGAEDYQELQTAIDVPTVLVTNLSADVRPGQSAFSARSATPHHEFSARIDEDDGRLFVEIIRRATIVNSGATWLVTADPELKSRFDAKPGSEPSGAPVDVALMLVVELKDAASLTAVNSYCAAYQLTTAAEAVALGSIGDELAAGRRSVVFAYQGERYGNYQAGTLPVRITLPNPHNAAYAEIAAEAEKSGNVDLLQRLNADLGLRSRFTLLEYSIEDGGDNVFEPLPVEEILPFGATRPRNASAEFSEPDEPANLLFDLTFALHRRLKGSKPGESNPYDVIGKKIAVRFGLRDIYGNSLPGDLKYAKSGPLSGILRVPYCDRIIPIGELPFAKFVWNAKKKDTLSVVFTVDAAGLKDSAETRAVYQKALWQLDDKNFSMGLRTTLTGDATATYDPPELKSAELLPVDKSTLRKLYQDVIRYIDGTVTAIPAATLSAELKKKPSAKFIETVVSIEQHRDVTGIDVGAMEVEHTVATVVLPSYLEIPTKTVKPVEPPNYRQRLEQFTAEVIKNLLPTYVAATGTPATAGRTGAGQNGEVLWFVEKTVLPRADVAATPTFYALPPLATTPVSFLFDAVDVWNKDEKKAEPRKDVSVRDLDADAAAKLALSRIEELLSPSLAKAFAADATGRRIVDKAMLLKEHLAVSLSDRGLPIFEKRPATAALEAVKVGFADRFRNSLKNVYGLDTALAFDTAWTATTPSSADPKRRPQFYGTTRYLAAQAAQQIAMMTDSLQLPRETENTSILVSYYDATNEESINTVRLDGFEITHVQRIPRLGLQEIKHVPIEKRYRETQWLTLVQPTKLKAQTKDAQIPIVRRELPVRPRLLSQKLGAAAATTGDWKAKLKALRSWGLDATWDWDGKPSDELEIGVTYTDFRASAGFRKSLEEGFELARAFARFNLQVEDAWPLVTEIARRGSVAASDAEVLGFVEQCLAEIGTRRRFVPTASRDPVRDVVLLYKPDEASPWKDELITEPSERAIGISGAALEKGGTLSISKIDILVYPQAITDLALFRNRTFRIDGKPVGAREEFVYSIKNIQAGEPLTPRKESRLELLVTPTIKKTLQEHVADILVAVFPLASVQAGHLFDIDASFLPRELSIGPSSNLGPIMAKDDVTPGVAICRITGLKWTGAEVAKVIADGIRRWSAAAYPELAGSLSRARLRLGVTIYRDTAGPSGRSPVFKVDRIELPTAVVTDLDKKPTASLLVG
jgi:hypothetical protein